MRKRVLVYSWYFPPINSSEGIVTYKLLNNSNYEYDVYSQNMNKSWAYTETPMMKLNSNIHYIDSETNNFNDFKINGIKYFEDNKDKYDIIMTRSMAEVSHEIGFEIKKKFPNIVWISSFGDPISNNPYVIISNPYNNPYSLSHRYERHMSLKEVFSIKRIIKSFRYIRNYKYFLKSYIKNNELLEKNTLNSSDYTIYNSTYQRDYMINLYKNKDELLRKAVVLPHSFDEKLYTDYVDSKNDKINFTFVGHLDDIRTPKLLFEALRRIKDNDENIGNKVCFNFYGDMFIESKVYLLDNDLLDVVSIKKPVDYLKSLEIIKGADWLIHIDANISSVVDENIFFAAKIADYLGTGNKIFAMTMINGISADILRDYNALVMELNSDEIYNYLYKIIYEGYTRTPNLSYREKYNAKNVSSDLDLLISKIRKDSNEN